MLSIYNIQTILILLHFKVPILLSLTVEFNKMKKSFYITIHIQISNLPITLLILKHSHPFLNKMSPMMHHTKYITLLSHINKIINLSSNLSHLSLKQYYSIFISFLTYYRSIIILFTKLFSILFIV